MARLNRDNLKVIKGYKKNYQNIYNIAIATLVVGLYILFFIGR